MHRIWVFRARISLTPFLYGNYFIVFMAIHSWR